MCGFSWLLLTGRYVGDQVRTHWVALGDLEITMILSNRSGVHTARKCNKQRLKL